MKQSVYLMISNGVIEVVISDMPMYDNKKSVENNYDTFSEFYEAYYADFIAVRPVH